MLTDYELFAVLPRWLFLKLIADDGADHGRRDRRVGNQFPRDARRPPAAVELVEDLVLGSNSTDALACTSAVALL